jgi:transposase-like protein
MIILMGMVINGVSMREARTLTEEFYGKPFSKSKASDLYTALDPVVSKSKNRKLIYKYPFIIVDALYTKVSGNSCEVKRILAILGVREDGKRKILGFSVADSESETSWIEFFKSLKSRGLTGVDLVVSDNHGDLVAAVKKQFHNASWQRFQTHFSRNILDKTPKKLQPKIKQYLKEIYTASKIEIARSLRNELLENYADIAPKAMNVLEQGFDDVMAVMSLPIKYRKHLRTSNSIERLNQEIRRRERAIQIFPNEASLLRLIGALLIEQDEKWSSGKKYLSVEEYYQFRSAHQITAVA